MDLNGLATDRLAAAADFFMDFDFGPGILTGDHNNWEPGDGPDELSKNVCFYTDELPAWSQDVSVSFEPGTARIVGHRLGVILQTYPDAWEG